MTNHLLPNHIFGINGALKNVLHFIDENTLLYAAGHNVVIFSLDQKVQKIIPGTPDTSGISAIAVSPSKKVVAIAEKASSFPGGPAGAEFRASTAGSDSRSSVFDHKGLPADIRSVEGESDGKTITLEPKCGPLISLYEASSLKKKKVLSGSEFVAGAREYVSISFSSDGKNIAAQAGGPDWNLVLWNLEKSKVVASVKASQQAEVYQVLYCPSDSSLLSVVGNGFAKSFKVSEISFRQIATDFTKREGHRFPWHVWLSQPGDRNEKDHENRDSCIYACDSGELIFAEGGEIISSFPADHSEGICYAEIIMLFSKGFICGEVDGKISIFEKVDEKEAKEGYKRTCSFLVDTGGAAINSMALSSNEDLLACILASNQLVTLPFLHRDVFKIDEVPKELNAQVYHSEMITGLDVCLRKPIVVTCSSDRSVRVWNYVERTCEIIKVFPEEPSSVSLHPSGFHVLVGFSDRLRFMNLLIDDIRTCKEIGIKACQECKFSTGGQYFAAVHVNIVQIFSTYSFENVGNLRGHSGKVRCIWWSADDTLLLTAGLDGAIYEWRMKDFKRSRENVMKGCLYTSVTGVTGSNSFFAVGSDKKLKEMDENQIIKAYPSVVVLAQIVLPHMSHLLFAATEMGSVRTYRYPLTGEYQETEASGAAITRMCCSGDDSLLFCTGEDGVLSIFDIKDKEKAISSGSLRREKEAIGWAEEVLMTKTDLEEMHNHCQELEEKVKELATDNEYQMRLKDLAMNERTKALNESFEHQIEESHFKYDKMLQQKNQEILDLEEKKIKAEEKHLQQLKDLEEQWRHKMMAEVERYSVLGKEKEMLNERWEQQHVTLVTSHQKTLQ